MLLLPTDAQWKASSEYHRGRGCISTAVSQSTRPIKGPRRILASHCVAKLLLPVTLMWAMYIPMAFHIATTGGLTQLGSDCFFLVICMELAATTRHRPHPHLAVVPWHWSWSLDRNHGFPTADPSPVDALAPRARSNPHALPPIRLSSSGPASPSPSLPSARHRVAWGPCAGWSF